MTQEEIYQKVVAIIQERQGTDFVVTPKLGLKDNLGADSVDLMEFILTLEDEFGIQISDEDAENIVAIKDLVKVIEERK